MNSVPGEETLEEQLRIRAMRDKVFMTNVVPNWVAAAAYVVVAAISIGVMPSLWPGVKAHYVLIAYILAPLFAFCNAYGMGLTDWSLLTTYGKVCIFIFAAWGGANGGGIIAGLATATAMAVIVGAAADLMQVSLIASASIISFNASRLQSPALALSSCHGRAAWPL